LDSDLTTSAIRGLRKVVRIDTGGDEFITIVRADDDLAGYGLNNHHALAFAGGNVGSEDAPGAVPKYAGAGEEPPVSPKPDTPTRLLHWICSQYRPEGFGPDTE
jgi:hypothetical protein